MRRIDAIGVGFGVLVAGGFLYLLFQFVGLDATNAGIWSQVILVSGLVGWLMTYVFRAVTGSMTYHQQRQDYEEAVLQKRLEELTPEEFAALQAEVESEQAAAEPKD